MGGGGGGQDPQMYRQKKNVYVAYNARASASEMMYFQVSKYICMHIQSLQFPFITYGMALLMTVY